MKPKTCVECNSVYIPKSGRAVVCGEECRRARQSRAEADYRQRQRDLNPPTILARVCKGCAVEFETQYSYQTFHDDACGNAYHQAHRDDRDLGTCRHPDGCPRPARKAGWCHMHYQRVKGDGAPGPAEKLTRWGESSEVCVVEGCEAKARALDMCHKHYRRARIHGDPGVPESLRERLPEEAREWTSGQRHRYYKYRLKPADFAALLAGQHGRCYICGTDKPNGKGWSVDHCHETNVVRFIACNPCNAALGLIKESPIIAKRLLEVALECQQLRLA